VTVSWSEAQQPIDGFGASSAFFGGNITGDVADQLFDAKKGIGLSLLRTMIGVPDDTQSDGSEPADAKPVATAPELATAQQAIARGARVWATAWTPPPIWKRKNSRNGSQTGDAGANFSSNKLDQSHYQEYANYLAEFVDLMAKNNVPLLGLSAANEPDYIATWDNAQWTPDELTTFISQNLGPTFAQRCPKVKIVAPDTASWPNVDSYVTPLLADPSAKSAVSVIATHPYQNGSAPIDLHYKKPRENGKAWWETEWSQENMKGDTPDPSMTSAIDMAKHIHDHMATANMNAWSWWAIYVTKDNFYDNVRRNPALIQPDQSMGAPYMFKRGYAFGNWSKFVRPGFQRIAATDEPTAGVLVEAYRDDSTHLALIAINTGSATVTQRFRLDGGTFGTLTPWVTSPDDSLAAKSTITATDSFSFDLPAQSVVTFVNWDATSETPGQVPPPTGGNDAGADAGVDTKPASSGGLDCSNAVIPNNGVNGGVTDFTDWKGSTGKWGDPQGLYGAIYQYAGPKGSKMNPADVDTTAKALHITGSVTAGDYGGAGLAFYACTTVVSFSQVQFTLWGSSPGCDMELQIKTFDQHPIDQTPAGGCYQDASATCYNFPVKKQVAVPSADATTVTTPLDSFANWSPENAAQVVGMQWQFTGTQIDPDAGPGCPIDVRITDVKFLP
jgi:glucuronoarabinoxylan endo-1,4-beta-xylanase